MFGCSGSGSVLIWDIFLDGAAWGGGDCGCHWLTVRVRGHCSLMMTNLWRSQSRDPSNSNATISISIMTIIAPISGSLVGWPVVRYLTKRQWGRAITFSNYSNELLHTMLQFCGHLKNYPEKEPGLFNSFSLCTASAALD